MSCLIIRQLKKEQRIKARKCTPLSILTFLTSPSQVCVHVFPNVPLRLHLFQGFDYAARSALDEVDPLGCVAVLAQDYSTSASGLNIKLVLGIESSHGDYAISRTAPKTDVLISCCHTKTERRHHDSCLSMSHYKDVGPTSRERAARTEIEPMTKSRALCRLSYRPPPPQNSVHKLF